MSAPGAGTAPELLRDLPQMGTTIAGKYRLDSVIGSGGMGAVLAATHLELRRRVAIKVMLPRLDASVSAKARFLREARAAAAIGSDHAVRVFDVGTMEGDLPFMVMEYLEGHDLDEHLCERGALRVAEAVALMLQACTAVSAAHAAGIVHRDLKPANLFLANRDDGSSRLVVLDFGISKSSRPNEERSASLTAPEQVLGSPQYMAPEQVRSAAAADERSDVWSLAVVLYELLTGAPPFVGESIPHVYALVMNETHRPLRELRPDVPAELESLIDRCLEKDPGRRLVSVDALAAMLQRFAGHEGGQAQVVVQVERQLQGAATTTADVPSDSARPSKIVPAPNRLAVTGGAMVVKSGGRAGVGRLRAALIVVGLAVLAGVIGLFGWREPGPASAPPTARSEEPSPTAATTGPKIEVEPTPSAEPSASSAAAVVDAGVPPSAPSQRGASEARPSRPPPKDLSNIDLLQ